jgi:hypothetical protein
MEVLSLALLAAASGGLLAYKKKQKDDKKKKESSVNENFISPKDDSLFATTVVGSNGLPEIHNEYVQSATTKFNPLAALFNPSKVNFASNANTIYPTFNAPDNTTVQNMLQSSDTRYDSRNDIVFNDALNQKRVSSYRIPNSSNLTSLVNLCELTPVATTLEGADCTVFDRDKFKDQCGICHKNAIATLPPTLNTASAEKYGSNLNINGPYGLYVSPRLTAAVAEEITQRQTLVSVGVKPQAYIPSPSLGQCGKDPDTNQSYFSLSKDMCKATNKFLKCKEGPNFSNTACYQCSANNKYYFIDRTNANITKRQRTEFDIWGSGQVSIQMDDTLMYLTQPNNNNVTSYQSALTYITLLPTRTKIILPLSSNSNISDNNELESADGKTLIINLSATNTNSPTPYIQGLFLGVLPDGSVKTTDFAITTKAIVGGDEKLPYVSGNPDAYKLYPEISSGRQSRSAQFKVLIPYMYLDPSATEKNYCTGPFIRNPNVATKLKSLCYTPNDGPGNYSKECLQQMFLAGGCTSEGLGYPNDATSITKLNRDQNGESRNLGDITAHVTGQYNRAWSGKDANQSNLPISDWQDSIKYCLNSDSTSTDPCELLQPSVQRGDPGAAPISDQCIRHLYLNSRRIEGFVTYTSNVDARSLFDTAGSNDRYCTEFGSISPLSNASNIALAQEYGRSNGGIAGIKQFYNNIHSRANIQNMTNAQRNEFMQKCYGKTLTVQADANPAIVNGMQEAQTSCGVKARYVKLTNTGKHIMINQIIVNDARGQNVALKKPTRVTSLETGYTMAGSVDGVYAEAKTNINKFKSLNTGNQWWMVDLNGVYDIIQVIYYNTNNEDKSQASGMEISLLNKDEMIISNTTKTFTNAEVQFFDYKTSTSEACPSIHSGMRGNLLSPVNRATNVMDGSRDFMNEFNQEVRHPIFRIVKPPQWKVFQNMEWISWIWNEPYAGGNAFVQPVTFKALVGNSTNNVQECTFYYRASSIPTSILFNNVIQTVSVNDTKTSENPASIPVLLLPGNNYIQITVPVSTNSPAGFIAAFSRVTSSGTIHFNVTQPMGAWISSTSPKIGSYSMPAGIEQSYVLSPPSGSSTNNGSALLNIQQDSQYPVYPNVKPIWNQPDAWYGAAVGTVDFYLSFFVGGDRVKEYAVIIGYHNTSNQSIELNGKVYTDSQIILPVVPGSNIIKVSMTNEGNTPRPAGTVLRIADMGARTIIPETQDSTNWKVLKDVNWNNDPCLYVLQGSNLPFKCASNAFKNAGCPQTFTSAFYNNFKSMSLSNLLNEYRNNWASSNATNANQISCYGRSLCDVQSNFSFNCASNIFKKAGCTQPFSDTYYPANFKTMSSNALLAEYTNNWASKHANSAENQTSCKGTSICEPGFKYNDSLYSHHPSCLKVTPLRTWSQDIYNEWTANECRSNYSRIYPGDGQYRVYCKENQPSNVEEIYINTNNIDPSDYMTTIMGECGDIYWPWKNKSTGQCITQTTRVSNAYKCADSNDYRYPNGDCVTVDFYPKY